MDNNTYHSTPHQPYHNTQRSPSQQFSSPDAFAQHRGSASHNIPPYTPTDTVPQSPFGLASAGSQVGGGVRNFQDPTENPYFRRQSVVEFAQVPGRYQQGQGQQLQSQQAPLGLNQQFGFGTGSGVGVGGREGHSQSGQPPVLQPLQTGFMDDEDMNVKTEHDEHEEDEEWRPSGPPTGGRGRGRVKREVKSEGGYDGMDDDTPLDSDLGRILVNTKFPVARIKRIMQADEDVGKVAQVTPVAVSKALELFMIALITAAASEARTRGQKRVGAAHLKQTIVKNANFDFLSEIAERIPDAAAKNGGSGDEGKPKTKGRRKKKEEAD